MIFIWKWIVRPALIIVFGVIAPGLGNDHPILSSISGILAITVFILTFIDLLQKVGIDLSGVSDTFSAIVSYILIAMHDLFNLAVSWPQRLAQFIKDAK